MLLFLFVLFLCFAIDNDTAAAAFRNPHLFAGRAPSAIRDCSCFLRTASTALYSMREENNAYPSGDASDTDAESFLLEYSIDSFLRGDYDRTFSEDAASPLPGLSASETVDAALRSLRNLDQPEPSHGAAVFLRFCVELGRGERWGTTGNNNRQSSKSAWKELLRGALTPTMLARRLRASEEFSGLLDWTRLEVADAGTNGDGATVFRNANVACVDASLFFDDAEKPSKHPSPPEIYRFELAKILGGVWLIDSVEQRSSGVFRQRRPKPSPRRSTRKARGSGNGRPPRRGQQQRGKPRQQRRQEKGKFSDQEEDKPDKRKKK